MEKREILSHQKKISSKQLFSNFFSKTITFTKFLQKECEREFLQFPHCAQYNSVILDNLTVSENSSKCHEIQFRQFDEKIANEIDFALRIRM